MSLIVKPISAQLTKDYDFIGKSDPYCIIFVGNQKQRTRTCQGGGKQPYWTDTFSFNPSDQVLRIQVWDDDTFRRDDFIGEGSVSLGQFYANPMRTENQYIDLLSKNKTTGRVLLSIEYQGPTMGGMGPNQGGWGNTQNNYQGGAWGQPQNQGNWNRNQSGWGQNQSGWGQNQSGWGMNQGGGGWNNPGMPPQMNQPSRKKFFGIF